MTSRRAARAPRRFPNPHPAPGPTPARDSAALPSRPFRRAHLPLGHRGGVEGRRVRDRTCHGATAARTAATRRGGGGRTGWNRIGARPSPPRTSPPAGPPPAPIGCAARRRPSPRPRIGAVACHSAASPRPPGPSLGGRDPGRGAGRSRPTPLGSLFEADSKSAVCALIRGGVSRGRRVALPQCPGRLGRARSPALQLALRGFPERPPPESAPRWPWLGFGNA